MENELPIKSSLRAELDKLPGHTWSNIHVCLELFFKSMDDAYDEEDDSFACVLADCISALCAEMESSASNVVFDLVTGKRRYGEFSGLIERRCGTAALKTFEAVFSRLAVEDISTIFVTLKKLYNPRIQR